MGSSRRDEVLDELVELFLAEGFSGFGVGGLAARLRCSRTTLYLVAPSKEQIVLAAVRRYFRRAAERIEARVAGERNPGVRLHTYLSAVADELAPATPAFHADLATHPPAAEVYRDNTRRAARRVQDLVVLGVESGQMRPVDAAFVGAAVAQVMTGIQTGTIAEETGLDDAAAYAGLADLVVQGLARRP